MTVHKIILAVFLSIALLPLTAYAQQPTANTFLRIGITNSENAEFSEAIKDFATDLADKIKGKK